MKPLTFKTHTFGCRVNQAETTQIEKNLQKAGFQPTKGDQLPNIVIINTCTVTQKAEKEVRQLARRVRRENLQSFLILCGCTVDFWQKTNFPKLPVDLWITNEQKDKIAQILKKELFSIRHPESCPERSRRIISEPVLNSFQESEIPKPTCQHPRPTRFATRSGRVMAQPIASRQVRNDKISPKSDRKIIKIQDGCDQFCSYCIVPHLRGKPKTKKVNQIIKEVKEAEKNGVKEIVLSGINLGLFGQDTNETIPKLLQSILKKTNIPQISFGSIYPEIINEKFIKLHINDWKRGNKRLRHFFHLPLQSGSEKILKLMGRKYSLKKFKSIIEKLHQALPQALIATDIIVGFPGENEKEFQETYQFLKNSPISKFHVFRFSPRKGTLAAKMEKEWGRVDEKTKKQRAKILRELGETKHKEFLIKTPRR